MLAVALTPSRSGTKPSQLSGVHITITAIQPNSAMPADKGRGSTGTGTQTGGNGFTVVAHSLVKAGVKNIYGVIGIPVTELASAAQVTSGLPKYILVSSSFFFWVGPEGGKRPFGGRLPCNKTGETMSTPE